MSLEDEFKKVVEDNRTLIEAKVAHASKLLDEAITLAEEHGIPFYSSISEISQQYTPGSFKKKWGEVDEEVLASLDVFVGEYDCGGWAHSDVC